MSTGEKLIVYFDDERPLMMRIGAAAIACWQELTPHAQRHVLQRAGDILDEDDEEAPDADLQLQDLIADHWTLRRTTTAPWGAALPGAAWQASILNAARTLLDMDMAYMSRFDGADRVICAVDARTDRPALTAGQRIPLSVGYCAKIVTGALPEIIPDTARVTAAVAIPETRALPIGAHLGVALRRANGSVFGTLCCLSHEPRRDLAEVHRQGVLALAELIV